MLITEVEDDRRTILGILGHEDQSKIKIKKINI